MLTVNATQVQKHQIMGPVGYTKVGSPTITDGMASNMSPNDYIKIGTSYTEGFSDFEVCIKAKPKSSQSGNALFCQYPGTNGIVIYFSPTSIMFAPENKYAERLVINRSFSENSFYYIRAKKLNDTISLEYSSDGQTYQGYISGQTTAAFDNTRYFVFSKNPNYGSGEYFAGSIDLNETYIKANGKLWFYQPAPTKYIVKDDKLVFASQDLYLSGPNNYTVVGTPTIVDGVASGLSDSNYLTISGTPYGASNNVEMRIKFTPTEKVQGYIAGLTGGGIYLTVVNNLLRYGVSIQGSTQTTAGSAYAIQDLNIPYYLHYTFDAATLGVKVGLSSDGLNPTYGINITATQYPIITQIVLGKTSIANNYYLRGSIDLKETYIKVNGDLWFYGKNYATKNIAPVPSGYTYGTTTTNAIGWVDMRTQQFTAAPSGATIGRDE